LSLLVQFSFLNLHALLYCSKIRDWCVEGGAYLQACMNNHSFDRRL
jgi:hypothetical protein